MGSAIRSNSHLLRKAVTLLNQEAVPAVQTVAQCIRLGPAASLVEGNVVIYTTPSPSSEAARCRGGGTMTRITWSHTVITAATMVATTWHSTIAYVENPSPARTSTVRVGNRVTPPLFGVVAREGAAPLPPPT